MKPNVTVGLIFYQETDSVLDRLRFFCDPELENSVHEVILVANAAKPATIEKIQNSVIEFKNVHLIIQDENNLAMARQKVLDHAQSEWIYFTDPDCEPTQENFMALLKARHDSVFAVAGPNLPPAHAHPFYRALQLLSESWLGNFGSSQSKVWSQPRRLSHAPTCNLLIQKNKIRFSFNPVLAKTGEDLDFNLQHCQNGADHILYLPQAYVWHYHPTNYLNWARKVFKWGFAQPWVVAYSKRWKYLYRLSPLVGFFIALILFFTSAEGRACFVSLYLGLTIVNTLWICLKQKSPKFLGSHLILTWTTHLAYAIGQIYGSWRLGTFLLSANQMKTNSLRSRLNSV